MFFCLYFCAHCFFINSFIQLCYTSSHQPKKPSNKKASEDSVEEVESGKSSDESVEPPSPKRQKKVVETRVQNSSSSNKTSGKEKGTKTNSNLLL